MPPPYKKDSTHSFHTISLFPQKCNSQNIHEVPNFFHSSSQRHSSPNAGVSFFLLNFASQTSVPCQYNSFNPLKLLRERKGKRARAQNPNRQRPQSNMLTQLTCEHATKFCWPGLEDKDQNESRLSCLPGPFLLDLTTPMIT